MGTEARSDAHHKMKTGTAVHGWMVSVSLSWADCCGLLTCVCRGSDLRKGLCPLPQCPKRY